MFRAVGIWLSGLTTRLVQTAVEVARHPTAISSDDLGLSWAMSTGECGDDSVQGTVDLVSFHQQRGGCLNDLQLCGTHADGGELSGSTCVACRPPLSALPGGHRGRCGKIRGGATCLR